MSVVEAQVVVEASPGEVWAVVADPHNLPQWDRHIVGVEGAPPDGLRPGTEYTTLVRLMGVTVHVGAEVVELRPLEYSRIRLHGIVDGVVETWVEPLDGGRTRLRHRVEYRFPGGPLGELAATAVRLMGASMLLARGTRAQKRQIEDRSG